METGLAWAWRGTHGPGATPAPAAATFRKLRRLGLHDGGGAMRFPLGSGLDGPDPAPGPGGRQRPAAGRRLLGEVLVVDRDALQPEDGERRGGGQEGLGRDEREPVEGRLAQATGDAEDREVGHDVVSWPASARSS